MISITIHSKTRDYKVVVYPQVESINIEEEISFSQTIYVIDSIVWDLHKTGVLYKLTDVNKIILNNVSEEIKTLETAQNLYEELVTFGVQRSTRIIAIGGGIVQDICGFVASTIFRGINWDFIPTTLLAQVDSCIGGKSSLNFKGYKNLLGTFYPPTKVEIYPEFLSTLDIKDFYSGLGEVIKLHIIAGENSYLELKSNLPNILLHNKSSIISAIHNSLNIKKSFIEDDEFDVGKRRLLNYGHCFGHAIEASSSFRIPHGQAVIIGMLLANLVSVRRKLLSKRKNREFTSLLLSSLSITPTVHELNPELIITGLMNDKKRSGSKFALVLCKDDFEMELIQDLDNFEVVTVLLELHKIFSLKSI